MFKLKRTLRISLLNMKLPIILILFSSCGLKNGHYMIACPSSYLAIEHALGSFKAKVIICYYTGEMSPK